MPTPGAGAGPDLGASSLYVGGLAPRVCTELLHDVFSIAGKVTLCRVVADKHSGASMGFGFVDYPDHATALRAQQLLNGRVIYGHELTVDWAHANSNAAAGRAAGSIGNGAGGGGSAGVAGSASAGASGAGNAAPGPDGLVNGVDISNHYCLFIGNLDASVADPELFAAFSAFGECSSAQVSRDAAANSRRCAFVSFKDRAAAQAAIDGLNGQVIANRPMRVDWARTKTNAVTRAAAMGLPDVDRGPARSAANGAHPHQISHQFHQHHSHHHQAHHHQNGGTVAPGARSVMDFNTILGQTPYTFTTVYVSGLSPTIDDDTLRAAFDAHGTITDVRIPESARSSGGDKIYAFVVYSSHDSAARAIFDAQGGLVVAGRNVTVQWGRESNRAVATGLGGGPGTGRRLTSSSAIQLAQHTPHGQHVLHHHAQHMPAPGFGGAPAPGYANMPQHPQYVAHQQHLHQSYSAAAAVPPGQPASNGLSYVRTQGTAVGQLHDQVLPDDSAAQRQQRPPY